MKILWLGLERNIGLDKNKHSVFCMTKDTFNFNKVKSFKPDIVIQREFNDGKEHFFSEMKLLKETMPKTKRVFWFIDAHVAPKERYNYCKLFDYIFVAPSPYINRVSNFNKNVFWLPLCFPSPIVPDFKDAKEYLIGFVGRFRVPYLEGRTDFLNKIKDEFGEVCHFVTDYATVYQTMSKCNIMLNKSFADDLNFRVFEALACKNVLVTNYVPDFDNIKGLKEKIHIYKTDEEAIKLINKILENQVNFLYSNDFESNTNYIKKYHTISNRVNSMLKMIKTKVQEEF